MLKIKLSKKHIRLTDVQIENMKALDVFKNLNSNTTEEKVLKILRKMPIKKNFNTINVTNFNSPKFNCIIKPLNK